MNENNPNDSISRLSQLVLRLLTNMYDPSGLPRCKTLISKPKKPSTINIHKGIEMLFGIIDAENHPTSNEPISVKSAKGLSALLFNEGVTPFLDNFTKSIGFAPIESVLDIGIT